MAKILTEEEKNLQQQKQNKAANSYNYDPSGNQGYQNANSAIGQMQANKPSASYDASADTNYQQANSALQQAQANRPSGSYDPISDTAYQQAIAALQQAQSAMPGYAGTYDSQLNDLYNQIVNRDKFSYDLNSDMLYQQYRDQYMHMGQQAMMDTMGQAAALTGGYGSSYAQQAGQQAYNSYLNQLNAVIPELYNTALNRYNAEGDALMNQYAMLGDMRDTEYGRYQDEMANYWQNVGFLAGQADTAYNRGYADWQNQYNDYWQNVDYLTNRADTAYNQGLANWQNQYNDYWQNMDYLTGRADTEYSKGYEDWYNSIQMQNAAEQKEYDRLQDAWEKEKYEDETAYNREQDTWEKEKYESETAYDRQQDAYSNLVTAIASTGYTPTAEELTAAGMSQAEAEAWLNYFNLQNGTSYSYGSSGGSGGSGYYSGSGSSSGGSSSGSSSGSGSSGSSGSSVANTVIGTTAFAPDGIQVGSNPADIQYIDYDYLASQGNKNNTSSSGGSKTKTSTKTSSSSSSSSGNKQTQAGSSNSSSSNKGTELSSSKMASTISAYKSQIKSSYGSNLTTAQMNAYLKNKILYSSYSSAQKTQLLKYAGLM